VAARVNHFATRGHGPICTWWRVVICSARSTASNTNDTIGSSNHADHHASDPTGALAAAKCWTLVMMNANPRAIPVHISRSTWVRACSTRSATTSGSV
jgi:hypothetical protein